MPLTRRWGRTRYAVFSRDTDDQPFRAPSVFSSAFRVRSCRKPAGGGDRAPHTAGGEVVRIVPVAQLDNPTQPIGAHRPAATREMASPKQSTTPESKVAIPQPPRGASGERSLRVRCAVLHSTERARTAREPSRKPDVATALSARAEWATRLRAVGPLRCRPTGIGSAQVNANSFPTSAKNVMYWSAASPVRTKS